MNLFGLKFPLTDKLFRSLKKVYSINEISFPTFSKNSVVEMWQLD